MEKNITIAEKLGIRTPTLLVDKTKCMANIERMWKKANSSHVALRPNFKTHQSIEIGRWFQTIGLGGISVSSMKMAEYFAGGDFSDITVCVPVNPLEIDRINALAENVKLNCLVDSVETMRFLVSNLKSKIGLFLEIDCGHRRTGIPSDEPAKIQDILDTAMASSNALFKGFLTHSGHSYGAGSKKEIERIHKDTVKEMQSIKNHFDSAYPDPIISIGDTPCLTVVKDLGGMNEARPGNFVFFDLIQKQLGVCGAADIAVAMACPVIGRYTDRDEVVIYGGGVHLGKESITDKDKKSHFGEVVRFNETGWGEPIRGVRVRSLSQEHGIVDGPPEFIDSVNVGDLIGVLPVHSCITADAAGGYVSLAGRVLDHMKGS